MEGLENQRLFPLFKEPIIRPVFRIIFDVLGNIIERYFIADNIILSDMGLNEHFWQYFPCQFTKSRLFALRFNDLNRENNFGP